MSFKVVIPARYASSRLPGKPLLDIAGKPMVVRVVAATGVLRPQQEYGYFETWTEAQAFAALLNHVNGIEPVEAQQIIVSATLASRCAEQTQ